MIQQNPTEKHKEQSIYRFLPVLSDHEPQHCMISIIHHTHLRDIDRCVVTIHDDWVPDKLIDESRNKPQSARNGWNDHNCPEYSEK